MFNKKIVLSLALLLSILAIHAKPSIGIILGSTRQGRFSDPLSDALKKIARKKGIIAEIIDLRDYQLPFLEEETLPAMRSSFTNKAVQKWSEKIASLQGFIILCPEYNAGYPGVLKNAIDSLYREWTKKPVGIISYSSGQYAGTGALAQLKQVLERMQMVVPVTFSIPLIGQAFNKDGSFVDLTYGVKCEQMLDQIVAGQK